jgi:hypothetical protein
MTERVEHTIRGMRCHSYLMASGAARMGGCCGNTMKGAKRKVLYSRVLTPGIAYHSNSPRPGLGG